MTRSRSSCTPGSRKSATSQPSPEVPRPNRPSLVAEHGHHHVRLPRVRGGVREPGAVRLADGAAGGVVDLRGGKFGPQRGEDGGGRRPFGRLWVPSAEVAGHAVAPVEGQRVVGQRPGHGDPGVPVQRQGARPGWPAAPRIPRPAAGPARGARAGRGRGPRRWLVRGRGLRPGQPGSSRPRSHFCAQHPAPRRGPRTPRPPGRRAPRRPARHRSSAMLGSSTSRPASRASAAACAGVAATRVHASAGRRSRSSPTTTTPSKPQRRPAAARSAARGQPTRVPRRCRCRTA